jgi:hypothetical protein
MIDWPAALDCAARLTRRPADTTATVAAVLRDAPVFRNREFPLSPLPLLLRAEPVTAWARDVEAYVRLLNKIVNHYLTDAEVRRWYALGPAAERLILADRRLGGAVLVCRLDGYLRQGSERPVLLENNADAPAGSLFTSRINRTVSTVLDRLDIPLPAAHPLTYTADATLLATLLAQSPGATHVAILQPHGAATAESAAMVEVFGRYGVHAYLADPRAVRVHRSRVYFGDLPADVCWNKVNTAPWRTLVTADPSLIDRWVAALAEPSFTHVNPFGARYVAESKLSLALPQEPEFGYLFTDDDRDLVARMLPPARRVSKENYQDLLDRPARYVLKEPYDIRGDGVTIGRSATPAQWRQAVDDALDHGHLAQEYVAPASYPTVPADGPAVLPMSISLDTFVFDGRVRGLGSKASLNARVNVFQGGQKLAVRVLDAPHAA